MRKLQATKAFQRRSIRGSVLLMAAFMLFATAAWGQVITIVSGGVGPCKADKYQDFGTPLLHYKASGHAESPECDAGGEATAESTARPGPPVATAEISAAQAPNAGSDSASASTSATDGAILTPPEGYDEDTTSVEITGTMKFELKGVVGNATGDFTLQVLANGTKVAGHTAKSDGEANTPFISDKATVSVLDGIWVVTVTTSGTLNGKASDASGVTGNLTISDIKLNLQPGWTCQWKSNGSNCGS